jgi:23S rRNA (guanosine2251-2'-O)-methyltransferase
MGEMGSIQRMQLYLVLHNIRSTYNVGAMFRTADGAGVTHVYLTGYTPLPIDRFGRKRADIAKAALGAEETMSWSHEEDVCALVRSLKTRTITVAAVEQHARSVPYTSFVPRGPTALVMGAEVTGIPQELLDLADVIIDIPMYGAKESLNVSVAAGIALYQVRVEMDRTVS